MNIGNEQSRKTLPWTHVTSGSKRYYRAVLSLGWGLFLMICAAFLVRPAAGQVMANSAARVALPAKARVNFSAVPAVPAPTEGSDPRASLQGLELSPRSTLPGAWSFAPVPDQTLGAGSPGWQVPLSPASAIVLPAPAVPLASPAALEQPALAGPEAMPAAEPLIFSRRRKGTDMPFVSLSGFMAAKAAALSEPLGAVPAMASQSGEFAYRLGHRLLELIAMEDAFGASGESGSA